MACISPLLIEPYNESTISLNARDSGFYTGCFYCASIPSYMKPSLLSLLLLSLLERFTGSCEIGTYYYSEVIL